MNGSNIPFSHNLNQDDRQEEDQWAFGRDLGTSVLEIHYQRRFYANRETSEVQSSKCSQENVYVQPAQNLSYILIIRSFKDRRGPLSFRIRVSRTRSLKIHKHKHTRPCFALHLRLKAHLYRSWPATTTKICTVFTPYHTLNTCQIRALRNKETQRLLARFK
jgi:hypothetical protein